MGSPDGLVARPLSQAGATGFPSRVLAAPGDPTLFGKKYVERVEEATIDTLVLHEVRSGASSRDQLVTRLRTVAPFNFQEDRIRDAVDRIEKDNHIRKEGDRYTITDDGREDLQKIETYFRSVADRIGQPGRAPVSGTPLGGTGAGATGTAGTGAAGGAGRTGGPTGPGTTGGPTGTRRP